MSSLNRVKHMQLGKWHSHGRVLLHGMWCCVHVLMSVYHRARLLGKRMLTMALLCLAIHRPWMYLFLHLDRRWGPCIDFFEGAKDAMYVWIYAWPIHVLT